MNEIKTFSFKVTKDFLNKVGEAAEKTIHPINGKSYTKTDFIIKCICEGIEKTKEVE